MGNQKGTSKMVAFAAMTAAGCRSHLMTDSENHVFTP
jgi:hypothetical protein